METAETETVTVLRDDLELLRKVCACYAPHPPADDISEAMGRTLTALRDRDVPPEASLLPPGRYGRVEIPGYRENEGWISEETRFGLQVAVVRDRDGTETAAIGIGPLCRVVWLPVPELHLEPRLALPAGGVASDEDDPDDEDERPF
jgi:hypothetical protein